MQNSLKKSSFFTSLEKARPVSGTEPPHEQVNTEELNQDDWKSSTGTAKAAREANDMHKIHTVYADYFVSFMRVRYAWGIFAMLVCWLGVDVVVLLANATNRLDIYVLYGLSGAILGFWIGGLWGYACRNRRGLRDVKAVYKLGIDTPERMDLAERNIQLRVWRSVGSAPICLGCTVVGTILMRSLAPCMTQGQAVVPFHLSDAVLMTLIGSTTASVIGIFLIVLHWLFPKEKQSPEQRM